MKKWFRNIKFYVCIFILFFLLAFILYVDIICYNKNEQNNKCNCIQEVNITYENKILETKKNKIIKEIINIQQNTDILYIPSYDNIDISEEKRLGDMALVAQLVQAEAGNQDLKGKQLVADVVYNRVRDPRFPNTVEEVIFQKNQFSVIKNGSFDKAAWNIDEDSFKASETEYYVQLDSGILYFNNSKKVRGKDIFKYGDHWFGY